MASEKSTNSQINLAFLSISRRAESVDRETLVKTFVDIGPLFAVLSTYDHQIVYGRRGTGKTHALLYVAEQNRSRQNASVYIDLRYIGSSGGVYGSQEVPIAQRATRLLLDVLGSLHEALLKHAIEEGWDLSKAGPVLDKFANATTELEVVGETTKKTTDSNVKEVSRSSEGNFAAQKSPSVTFKTSEAAKDTSSNQLHVTEKGVTRYRVHFGSVSSALRDMVFYLPFEAHHYLG